MTHSSLTLAAAIVVACHTDPSNRPPPRYAAQIQRTSFGVPHIRAADEKGLGYGLGVAFAEDNLCTLSELIVTVNGERSRYFGRDGSYDPGGDDHPLANLDSDVYFAVLNEASQVAATWARQRPEIQDLLLG